jgi:cytochrome b561
MQNLAVAPMITTDPPPPLRYDPRSIILHWCTAVLVALLWIIAQIINDFANGPLRVDARSLHITLGIVLVAVLGLRIIWRNGRSGAVTLVRSGLMERAAHLGHILLYVLAILAVLSGMANEWVRGDSIFNLFTLPSPYSGDRELRKLIGTIHAYATNALLIAALGHAALALFHQYVLRDGVLERMLPARSRQ